MFRFFHVCTHRIREYNTSGDERTIKITNDGNATDLLIRGATIERILSVQAITYQNRVDRDEFGYDNTSDDHRYEDRDLEDGYYDGANHFFVNYAKYFANGATTSNPLPETFYEAYLHNRIKWLVEPPLSYVVTVLIRYTNGKSVTYNPTECPYCQGKGWFVDILDNDEKFGLDSGIEKVSQRIVKDLMTELYSSVLNLEYGTVLKQTVASASKDDEAIFDDIRMVISEVEDRYLLRQQSEYDTLEATERLLSLRVEDARRSTRDKRRITLELRIETEEESRSFRFVI
jgi:hypothetical protein